MCGIKHTREDHFWQFVHAISKFPLIHWLPIDGFSLVVRQWFRSVETNNLVVIITWQERCHQGEIGRNIFGNGTEPHQLVDTYFPAKRSHHRPPLMKSSESSKSQDLSGWWAHSPKYRNLQLYSIEPWVLQCFLVYLIQFNVQWISNINVEGLTSYCLICS